MRVEAPTTMVGHRFFVITHATAAVARTYTIHVVRTRRCNIIMCPCAGFPNIRSALRPRLVIIKKPDLGPSPQPVVKIYIRTPKTILLYVSTDGIPRYIFLHGIQIGS